MKATRKVSALQLLMAGEFGLTIQLSKFFRQKKPEKFASD